MNGQSRLAGRERQAGSFRFEVGSETSFDKVVKTPNGILKNAHLCEVGPCTACLSPKAPRQVAVLIGVIDPWVRSKGP
jgi:hypothetical protein